MTSQQFDDSKIAEIQGPTGEFGIAFAGAGKDGLKYLYRDDKYRFFFYPQIETKPVWRVNVEATSGLAVSKQEEARLKENIELFFKTRHLLYPEREMGAEDTAQIVTFSWGVAQ
jgi:hypothetical protein